MAGRYKSDLKWSDVTPKENWLNRRALMAGAGALGLGSIAGPAAAALGARKTAWGEGLEPNDLDDITSYNNFYEFGTNKGDPAKYAHALTTDPWSVEIDGLVDKPGSYGLEDILKNDVERQRANWESKTEKLINENQRNMIFNQNTIEKLNENLEKVDDARKPLW